MIKLNGEALYQWETGRTVSGFTGNVAQFANAGDSIAMSITVENGGSVRIPDRYLSTGKNLVVYDVQTGKDNEETVISVKVFPVKGKAKPKDYVPTAAEEAYGVVKDLSDKAKSAAEAAEQAKNSAQTYAQDAGDYAQDAFNSATNAKESADKAAETVEKLSPLIVDINVANYDLPDILAALAAGRDVQLHVEDLENVPDGMYRLLCVTSDSALFATEEDGMLIVIHFHEEQQIKAYSYPLDLLDDEKEDSSHTWSSAKILEMIARGGTRDINMGDERGLYSGFLSTPNLTIAPSDTEGFTVKSDLVDGDFSKPAAVFGGTHEETSAVILRNIADGVQPHDAVSKGQMDASLNRTAKIDDSKIGADAWSSKNIIDRLCPPINKTGLLVQCEAVEGYPLDVQAEEGGEYPSVTVTVCGKNLYNADVYPLDTIGYVRYAYGTFTENSSSAYRFTKKAIPAAHLRGQTISIRKAPGLENGSTNAGIAFYDESDTYISGSNKVQVIVPENAAFMRFSIHKDYVDEAQIEIGSTATDYEPYSENISTAAGEALGDFIPVTDVVARPGLTTIFAYREYEGEELATEVKVSGRGDPNAKILRLTEDIAELKAAILTMGANV